MSIVQTLPRRALLGLAPALIASVALAQPPSIAERMTDARFIAVARCAGWEPVARPDAGIAALFAAEPRRTPVVQDRAQAAWADADRTARRAARGGESSVTQLRIRFDRDCSGLIPARQP